MKYTSGTLGSPFPDRKNKKRQALKFVKMDRQDDLDDWTELEPGYVKELLTDGTKSNRWRAILKARGYHSKYEVLEEASHWEWMEYTFSTRGFSIPYELNDKYSSANHSPNKYFKFSDW